MPPARASFLEGPPASQVDASLTGKAFESCSCNLLKAALCAFAPSICNELHAYQLHCHKPTATVQAPAAFIEQMCLQMCMLQVCLHMCMLQLGLSTEAGFSGLFNTGLKAAKKLHSEC